MKESALVLASVAAIATTFACDDKKPGAVEATKAAKSATVASAAPVASAKATGPVYTFSPPDSLGKPRVPKGSEFSSAKAALGHMLFFDKRMSGDGSVSCYSCHQNEDGTGGHDPTAVGAGGKKLTRHAPVIWNVAYLPRLYWDGRADTLEAQVKGAWGGGNMGVGKDGLEAKAKELYEIPGYKAAFDEAFPVDGATPDTVAIAIASYERTIYCGKTAFDRFQAGDASAMTDDQKSGWKLFTGKAACNQCHVPPFFSDAYAAEQGVYHNTGIGIEGKEKDDVDPGRSKVSENPSEWAAFKTPTLRNVSKSAPYFHDGSRATLEEAVRFMAGGGYANDKRDPNLKDRKLTDEEIGQIVAFLGALECGEGLTKPKLP